MSIISLIRRNLKISNPPTVEKTPDALRCGILGAANIAPDALIRPAKSHLEFVISAVAARDKTKAETYAQKYGIPKAYSGPSGYQDLLDDKEIDVIYNPLPNGLHYEWTIKALNAGKHVLLEKPSANTAEETRAMFALAEKKGLVLLEAFHCRFHPALNRLKEIVHSGELGKLKSIETNLVLPNYVVNFPDSDIRFNYKLGGGIMMDMGCYCMMSARFIADENPTEVISAVSKPFPGSDEQKAKVDLSTNATLSFPKDVIAELHCGARLPGWGPFGLIPSLPKLSAVANCEGGTVELTNFPGPQVYHSIIITPKNGKKRTETAYKFKDGRGEEWWSTYRYQLEIFVDKVKGRDPWLWMDADDSVANMEWVDKVYEKSGLGLRPTSDLLTAADAQERIPN